MTVSTSVGRKFKIDKLVRMAYRRAGIISIEQEPNDAEKAHGKDTLEEVVDELETHGLFARVTSFVTLPITVDVTEYALPANVVDLLSPAMYIDPTNTDVTKADGETPIKLILEDEWTRLSSKSAKGRPTLMYADRSANTDIITAVLWPRPDEDGGSVRFYVHRRLADTDDGNATLDLQTYWSSYIISTLASRLAQDSSLDARAASLAQTAARQLVFAKDKANERPGTQIYVDHTGGWRA